ncbi:cystatin-A-like [Eriocheir sinensis]|uniref:cystatin-A-like n=1 Tax=Eriocheir sinensis TaxID=95602 RepID=UPI0021C57FA7|nr:cystatin-A-like [Eriocheir sinensis]
MAAHMEKNPEKPIIRDYLLMPEPQPLTEEKPVTPEVQELINEVRPVVEEQLSRPVSRYVGLIFKTNNVIGTDYFVKIDVGDNRMVHVRVHKSPEGVVTMQSIKHFTDNLDRELVYL